MGEDRVSDGLDTGLDAVGPENVSEAYLARRAVPETCLTKGH
jgi:hypothetical protein